MQQTPSMLRVPLLNLFLWGVPVLCSLFFATELLLTHQHGVKSQETSAPAPQKSAQSEPAGSTIPETSHTQGSPLLTSQQIDELLASIPKFSDRPVWDRRATIIGLDKKYKNLFVELGLNPEKAMELRSLVIERENADSRIRIALAKTGMPVMEILSASKEALLRYDQKIEQSLGPDNFAVFAHRTQNPGNYAILDDVISNLSVTEHPLSDDKKHALYAAVLKTSNEEAFMNTVAQALPPEQLQVLLDSLEAQTLSSELAAMRMEINRRSQAPTSNK